MPKKIRDSGIHHRDSYHKEHNGFAVMAAGKGSILFGKYLVTSQVRGTPSVQTRTKPVTLPPGILSDTTQFRVRQP